MWITNDPAVRPNRFADRDLGAHFGYRLGQLADTDLRALGYLYTEINLAKQLYAKWLELRAHAQMRTTSNGHHYRRLEHYPGWRSAADELSAFLTADQTFRDQSHLYASLQIVLCDRVTAELTAALLGSTPAAYFTAAGSNPSPLHQLNGMIAAWNRAVHKTNAVDKVRVAKLDELVALASARNEFAAGETSMGLDAIDGMAHDVFEKAVAWLIEGDDCELVRQHGHSNDRGADVIATTPTGLRVVIQCKHSSRLKGQVTPKDVYALNGTAGPEHGADIVAMVTNRTLTRDAASFARKHGIHVVDRPQLERWATYGVPWLPNQAFHHPPPRQPTDRR